MGIVFITGAAGLIGSEAARVFHAQGFDIYGVDNNLRKTFFGEDGSVDWNRRALETELKRYRHYDIDIRDSDAIDGLFSDAGRDVSAVVHAAAQPSHDWAAREPVTDFTVNANGTLNLLEAVRKHCPEAPFIFTSTNKVYGDTPNRLPLEELENRWELDPAHPFARRGIDETMSIDGTTHSLFGASKVAADVLVQEYGRYFGMPTVTFRCGCLTGPAHSAAELHGFLAYLVRCALENRPYTVFGYKGKQVRDNIHSRDLIAAFQHYIEAPRPGAVYNMGGGRPRSCSVLEAIERVESISGRKLDHDFADSPRIGDHIWWISDVGRFHSDYPSWEYEYTLDRILAEMIDAMATSRTVAL